MQLGCKAYFIPLHPNKTEHEIKTGYKIMANCCHVHGHCCGHSHGEAGGHHHHHHHHGEGSLRNQIVLVIATAVLLAVAVMVEKCCALATWQLLLVYLCLICS